MTDNLNKGIDSSCVNMTNRGGESYNKYELCDDVSYCLDANYWKGASFEAYIKKHRRQLVIEGTGESMESEYEIRRLTPLECWRLMSFSDIDFLAAKIGSRDKACDLVAEYEPNKHLEMMKLVGTKKMQSVSNTQLYRQAGNSIVVDVIYYIYKNLYEAMPYLFDDLKLSSFFSGIGAFEKALDKLYDNDINKINVANNT